MSNHRPTQNALYLIFFTQPIVLGAWLPRIPEVQEKLGLSASELALSLVGAPIGTLLSLLIAGRIGDALGAKKTMAIFYPIFFVAMLLPFIAPSQFALALALAAVGSSISILELGMNVAADEVEKQYKRLVMSKAHGLWSLGLMAGTLIGSAAAWKSIAPLIAGLALSVLFLPAGFYGLKQLDIQKPVPAPATDKTKRFTMPHPILLGICAFTFGTTLTEGAVADWAAIFMRDAMDAGPGASGLAVTAFTLIVATTRMFGDRLRDMFPVHRLAMILATIGLAGVTVVYFADRYAIALIGFGLIGLGASLAFPLAVSAAANAPGSSSANNVATLSFLALTGFLVGPVSIGFITEATNIRVGLLVLAPMLAISAIFAFSLNPNSSLKTKTESHAS
jgi:MFS family permease